MRRFEDGDESDSDSGGEDCSNFKRSKRFRRGHSSTSTEDEVDGGNAHGNNIELPLSSPESNGVTVIQYASSVTSHKASNNGVCTLQKFIPNELSDPRKSRSAKLQYRSSESMRDFEMSVAPPINKEESAISTNNNVHDAASFDSTAPLITDKSSATEIMRKMGFDKTKGMGKLMCDRDVSASKLEKLTSILEKAGIDVEDKLPDFSEELYVEEDIKWIPPVLLEQPLTYEMLSRWRAVGPKLTTLRNETHFMDADTLELLLTLKKSFNVFNQYEYLQIRARCNPFEKTGKGPFVSRAGLKMASLDAAMSYSLTQPTTSSSDKLSFVGPNELFYFADICAGPGGFSEYVLFKKRWGAKGFGMTLKGKMDFDVNSFFMGSPESFEPIYGPANDGDVYNPKNVDAFIDYVLRSTDGRGVHLMMADGGFDVENKELQEPLSAQIYVSQCLLALNLIRPGGMFICKLFDTVTPFTVGLIYLMYHSFELVAIHKPCTSRPANSERYLVCKWKAQNTDAVIKNLRTIHTTYWEWSCAGATGNAFLEIVPLSELKASKQFYEYLRDSNERIALQQIESMKRMVAFSRNADLEDPRQESVRKRCFEYLKVPEKSGKNIVKLSTGTLKTPSQNFKKLLGTQSDDFLRCPEFTLTEHNLEAFIRSPFDWRIVVIEAEPAENNRGFYLSLGNERIYRYTRENWVHIVDKVELCKDTLVFGEFVEEIHGKKPNQRMIKTFHIIDALVLGGTDVRGLHYTSRHEVCVKFAKSMNKPSRHDLCAVRAKIPVRMENIADVFDRLENRVVNGSGQFAQLVCPVDHTDETLPFIKPIGILFLKITRDPWTMALSRSSNRKYYFNSKTGKSSYEIIAESVSEFNYTMQNRIVWWWDKELKKALATQDVNAKDTRPISLGPNSLNPHTLLRYVGGAWQLNKNMVMRRLSSSSNSQGSC